MKKRIAPAITINKIVVNKRMSRYLQLLLLSLNWKIPLLVPTAYQWREHCFLYPHLCPLQPLLNPTTSLLSSNASLFPLQFITSRKPRPDPNAAFQQHRYPLETLTAVPRQRSTKPPFRRKTTPPLCPKQTRAAGSAAPEPPENLLCKFNSSLQIYTHCALLVCASE